MVKFLDGPAAGVVLDLRRAPVVLRVCRSRAGNWDALDQLDDVAQSTETIFVYIWASKPIHYHMRCGSRKGSGFRYMGEYRELAAGFGLDQCQLHDNAAWSKWCDDNRQVILDQLTPELRAAIDE